MCFWFLEENFFEALRARTGEGNLKEGKFIEAS